MPHRRSALPRPRALPSAQVTIKVLLCVAVSYCVLQCVAVCCSVFALPDTQIMVRVLRFGAVWCSVVQRDAVLQCGAVWCSVLQ